MKKIRKGTPQFFEISWTVETLIFIRFYFSSLTSRVRDALQIKQVVDINVSRKIIAKFIDHV